MSPLSLDDVRAWYAQQSTAMLVADALVTDEAGRVLLLQPAYKTGWLRPGGVVERDEAPHDAAARELREETGLQRTSGALLATEWCRMFDQGDLPLVGFTFDFGTVSSKEPLVLQTSEISDSGFFTPAQAERRVAPYDLSRLRAAVAARSSGIATYLSDGRILDGRRTRGARLEPKRLE
ncbi:NUDIX domain-containing protein [Flexivirga oryzae]|uniref:8-oxo-dGTP pyrophosphatase MutT (NUDIX family) n=1 Tax=Flexivirga oryzae TaxID=1794944 RepID=A0A839NBZ7_9MICO|nr:8-oxo-dGTP pyrophosphatase MutT (NUDIX family) [Flexivirga oryzae]